MTDDLDIPAVHAAVRTELIALLRDRGTAAVSDITVPGCPAWTVHDVLAHLAGVDADVLAGRLDGVASDPWTAAQVGARRSMSLDEILAEWEDTGPQVEAVAGDFGEAAVQWTMDCLTHDADVRGAIGEPVQIERAGLDRCVNFVAGGYLIYGLEAGVPVARLTAGAHVFPPADAGIAEVGGATAEASLFELLRGLTGRRSADQIRSWSWSTDPDPYLAGFSWGPFTVPTSDLPA